jgi:hypothetical protein
LFRLHLKSWAMQEGTLAGLFPVREPHLRVIEFDCDVSKFLGAQSVAAFPVITAPGPSYIVAFGRSVDRRQEPLFIDELTARILQLSNGTRTVSEIAETKLHLESLPHNFGNPKLSELTGETSCQGWRLRVTSPTLRRAAYSIGSARASSLERSTASFHSVVYRCRLARNRGLRSDPFYGAPGSECLLSAGGWQVASWARLPQPAL